LFLSISRARLDNDEICVAIVPVKELFDSSKLCKDVNCVQHLGRLLEIELLERAKLVIFVHPQREGGMEPLIVFVLKSSNCIADSCPKVDGSAPDIELLASWSTRSLRPVPKVGRVEFSKLEASESTSKFENAGLVNI